MNNESKTSFWESWKNLSGLTGGQLIFALALCPALVAALMVYRICSKSNNS